MSLYALKDVLCTTSMTSGIKGMATHGHELGMMETVR